MTQGMSRGCELRPGKVLSSVAADLAAFRAGACTLIVMCALVLFACLAPAALASEAASSAAADSVRALQSGYLSVSLDGVAAEQHFASLDELQAALNETELAGDVVISVYGTVSAAGSLWLAGGEDVSVQIVAGEGTGYLATSDAAPISIIVETGSLSMSHLSFTGSVNLQASEGISVGVSSFTSSLSCTAASVSVESCYFEAATPYAAGAACASTLTADGSVAFAYNIVDGYASALSVASLQGAAATVAFSNNTMELTQPVSDASGAIALAGSLASEATVTCEDNTLVHDTYLISYDANGATAGTAPGSCEVEQGGKTSAATCASLVKAGCDFLGWNTEADGTGVFYAAGQVFVPTGDLTLYAQWSEVGTVATVDVTTIVSEPAAQPADSATETAGA